MHLFLCASLAFGLFAHNPIYILPFLCAQIFHNGYNFEFDTYRSRSLKRCFYSFLNQTFNKNKFYYWTLDFENDKTLDEMRRINRKRLKRDEREREREREGERGRGREREREGERERERES
jgi:hypothetical protein